MEGLFTEVRKYIDLKIKYYKLLAVERLSVGVGKILALVVFIMLLGLALMLFTGALVVLVAQWLDSYLYAFLIVGGFFVLVALLFFFLRETVFTNSMVKTFGKMFFPADKEKDYE